MCRTAIVKYCHLRDSRETGCLSRRRRRSGRGCCAKKDAPPWRSPLLLLALLACGGEGPPHAPGVPRDRTRAHSGPRRCGASANACAPPERPAPPGRAKHPREIRWYRRDRRMCDLPHCAPRSGGKSRAGSRPAREGPRYLEGTRGPHEPLLQHRRPCNPEFHYMRRAEGRRTSW